jgi:predicted lipoprotein
VKRRVLLASLASGAFFPFGGGCGTSELPDKRRELLNSWGQALLLASYAEFEQRCGELEARTAELAENPDEETVAAAQTAWWAARAPVKRAEVFAFGPYTEEPERIGPKIDFWPARPDTVEAVLADDAPLDSETLEDLGAPAKGLPALEYLLYPPGGDAALAFQNPRRGEYAHAIALDLIARSRELFEAWDPGHHGFLIELVDAGRSSRHFSSLNAALGEIVNRIGFTLENARLEKLARALGDTSEGSPQPDQLESTFSGRSIDDLRDNLRGIELLYTGDAAVGLLGLDGYLNDRGKRLGRPFSELFSACSAAFDAVPGPLTEAIGSDPQSVRTLMDSLHALQRFFQVDVLNALSLTLAFNDNDGD